MNHGKDGIIGKSHIPLVIMSGKFTGKQGIFFSHLFLDKGMTYPAAHCPTTEMGNGFSDGSAGAQVVKNGCSWFLC